MKNELILSLDTEILYQEQPHITANESGEERINKKILARIDYLSPTERRRVSERDLIQ